MPHRGYGIRAPRVVVALGCIPDRRSRAPAARVEREGRGKKAGWHLGCRHLTQQVHRRTGTIHWTTSFLGGALRRSPASVASHYPPPVWVWEAPPPVGDSEGSEPSFGGSYIGSKSCEKYPVTSVGWASPPAA